MAGIAIVLDLIKKSHGINGSGSNSLHSTASIFSATLAASTAAAYVSGSTPFPSRPLFGVGPKSVSYCDAGPPLTEDYLSSIRSASENILQYNTLGYNTKEYNIQLKPLFSAFQWKAFALTSLRSFILFYFPILGPRVEEDDDDFLQEISDDQHVDLVVPFKKSVKQIIRETTVVTTRRVLERGAIHHFSQRMAWKLLKDVPKSAVRKADRGLPTSVYFFSVSRTTFRDKEESDDDIDKVVRLQLLTRRIYGTTVRCGSSLVFASIGAGLGATIFRPAFGQSIGCLVGDLAGPIIVTYCCEKYLHADI